MQIGANEGRFEYAKPDGKDFLFEFLHKNPNWDALLIEPLPDIFDQLRLNYSKRSGTTFFLNCAITEVVEERKMVVAGKEGKASRISPTSDPENAAGVDVQCLPYNIICRLHNWDSVDFVKIDAEGYDEMIVNQILDTSPNVRVPSVLMWEQIGPEKLGTSERLAKHGYRVLETGLAKNGKFLDRVALRTRR